MVWAAVGHKVWGTQGAMGWGQDGGMLQISWGTGYLECSGTVQYIGCLR